MERTKYSKQYGITWVLVYYSLNRMEIINLDLSAWYHHLRIVVDVSYLMIDLVRKFANATPPGKTVSTHSPSHFSIYIEDVMSKYEKLVALKGFGKSICPHFYSW